MRFPLKFFNKIAFEIGQSETMSQYHRFPQLNLSWLDQREQFVLLETNKFDGDNHQSYLFLKPIDLIICWDFEQVASAFAAIEEHAKRHYLAGFFSYELGYFFENKLQRRGHPYLPLFWLGVFDTVCIFDHVTNRFKCCPANLLSPDSGDRPEPSYEISDLNLDIPAAEYERNIEKIKRYIEAGDTYQVNFTTKYKFDFSGYPYSLYSDLKKKQEVAYNAFIKMGETTIISISPELFFRKKGNQILTRPMKGTWARGRTYAEDQIQAQKFASDEKNRSENLMIVDLMRNDLGRMSNTGSVKVHDLFAVEKYRTLFQMTSTIASELKDGMTYFELFQSIFPSGSVTGAPKIRTMQIIQELEENRRGVYTGAVGFISPHGEAIFNVPIRTLTLRNGQGEMGVGSGIVYDSIAEEEFAECQLKANFLIEDYRKFSLIESILWDEEFRRLPLHMKRLHDSAQYFDFHYDEKQIRSVLENMARNFQTGAKYKARLLLHKDRACEMSFTEITQKAKDTTRVVVSDVHTSPQDIFLFHKTTLREVYEHEHQKYSVAGFFDVIFTNTDGQITESAISNIFIQKEGNFYTPPVECGLLNGVYRQEFLAEHSNAFEKILYPDDLRSADAIYLTNAIRGMIKVQLAL